MDLLRNLFRRWRREERRPEAPLLPTPPTPSGPPRPTRTRMEVGWATHIGQQRKLNEDALLILEAWQEGHHSLPPFGLFVVADGMGGHLSGEIASALAARTAASFILQHVYFSFLHRREQRANQPSLQEILSSAIRAAHEVVTAQVPGGGTTLLCALVLGNSAYIANVGDSRAYLLNSTSARQITRDHSVVDILVEMGQMSPAEALHHPQRNVLYRAVGQPGPLEVDTFRCSLVPGETLLLCTDGLWEMVPEEEIVKTVANAPSVQAACEKLIEKANEAGGKDNISVILVAPPDSSGE
ncbi:MAG: protein phosphatase 2C domain-containing protein [Anaerolineae bacterium]|nr:protein phosphatase 2C domain-containing protein [Anaerolineae bacterium]